MIDYYEHIDNYMNGALGSDERSAFEAEMETNPSLRLAIENYASARSLSEGMLELDMMETLANLEEERKKTHGSTPPDPSDHSPTNSNQSLRNKNQTLNNDHPTSTSIFNLRSFIAAASMIGVICFAGWWISRPAHHGLDMEYVIANYDRPVDQDGTKSVDTIGMSAFEKGKYYFRLNRFEESEKWFILFVEKEKDKKLLSEGYYWLGAAHLEQEEVEEARKYWGLSDEEGVGKNLEMIK